MFAEDSLKREDNSCAIGIPVRIRTKRDDSSDIEAGMVLQLRGSFLGFASPGADIDKDDAFFYTCWKRGGTSGRRCPLCRAETGPWP